MEGVALKLDEEEVDEHREEAIGDEEVPVVKTLLLERVIDELTPAAEDDGTDDDRLADVEDAAMLLAIDVGRMLDKDENIPAVEGVAVEPIEGPVDVGGLGDSD